MNDAFRAADFFVDQTAAASTLGFVTVKVQGRVPGTTKYYTITTISPATTSTWQKRVRLDPDASTTLYSAGLVPTVLHEPLPAIWRVASTNASTGTVSYSVSANLYD
mgnify:CR=1 FL=1